MKRKTWIDGRMNSVGVMLKSLGLKSVNQLAKSRLLLHVGYGGEASGGVSYVVECGRLRLDDDRLNVDYEDKPISVEFSANRHEKLGGVFKGEDPDFSFKITWLEYSEGKWDATFLDLKDECGNFSHNFDVEILV